MVISEKTNINIGLLIALLGVFGSCLGLYASNASRLTRVEEKSEALDARQNRQGDYISKKVDLIEGRLYDIQQLIIELKNKK